MTTSPTVPEWITELVPPETLRDASSPPITSAVLEAQLAPLVKQMKLLIELLDDVTLMRLTKAGHPVTRTGKKAIIPNDAYDIVDETREVFWELFPAFEVVTTLRAQLESCEWVDSLEWRCPSNDEGES